MAEGGYSADRVGWWLKRVAFSIVALRELWVASTDGAGTWAECWRWSRHGADHYKSGC
jgi:hypothetical protein